MNIIEASRKTQRRKHQASFIVVQDYTRTENRLPAAHPQPLFNMLPMPVVIIDEFFNIIDCNEMAKPILPHCPAYSSAHLSLFRLFDYTEIERAFKALGKNSSLNEHQVKHLKLVQNNSRPRLFNLTFSQLSPDQHIQGKYMVVLDEIRKNTSSRAEQDLAYSDPLTGCGNFNLLEDTIGSLTTETQAKPFALFLLDFDFFKLINDTHGRDIGDKLLKAACARLQGLIRGNDYMFRLGGDQFLIVFTDMPKHEVERKALMILQSTRAAFFIQNEQLNVSASIGISTFPKDGEDVDTLLKHADVALYQAKEQGRRSHQFFTPSLLQTMQREVTIEHHLRQALDNDEFWLAFMPQFECATQYCCKAEVLLRWNSAVLGEVPPSEFIPVAEKSGLIHPITEFVLSQTLDAIRELNNQSSQRFSLSFNATPLSLRDADAFERLYALLKSNSDISSQITLELTESIFADELTEIKRNMVRLKALGVRIAIDDFGTCYSSLAYLSKLPIDELKIDQAFTVNLFKDENHEKICCAICSLAKSLNFCCVAEGVETQAQFTWLQNAGCDYSQGYLHCKPTQFDSFAEHFAIPAKPSHNVVDMVSRNG